VKKLTPFFVALCVTACATPPEPPRLEVRAAPRIERVEVVVTKPCVAAADVPVPPVPTKVDVNTAGKKQVAAATAADVTQQDLYIAKAKVIIASCAK
jgi:hypothetical protein